MDLGQAWVNDGFREWATQSDADGRVLLVNHKVHCEQVKDSRAVGSQQNDNHNQDCHN